MEIKYVELTNYKSIKNANKIHFSSPFITFVGKNGSGKTNILEALFILFDQNQITFRIFLVLIYIITIPIDLITGIIVSFLLALSSSFEIFSSSFNFRETIKKTTDKSIKIN
jgi:predicted ATP-dependent endonuclease of OLD family